MAVTPFVFDPPTGWNDATVFPTYEGSEVKVRSDMQKLHDQTRDFINETVIGQLNQEIVLIETTVTELPKTVYDSAITANHTLLRVEVGTPTAQVDVWTVTTANGRATISGTVEGSTTLMLVLGSVGTSV